MLSFTCEREDLISAVNITSRTVSQKSTIPALEGILVTAGTMLTLTGYNLETGTTIAFDADVGEPGAVVFPARLFGDIVRKLPDSRVQVRVDDGWKARITSGNTSFTIMASPADDYPALPEVEYDRAVAVPQGVLKNMISGTLFSVSESQARPIQTGCKFEIDEDTLTVVAVDGYRLALRRETIENPEHRVLSFVAPAPALRELEKILEDTDDDASFTLGTRHIAFQIGKATLVCRLLEGEFLDWRRVIPKDNPIRIGVSVRELTRSLDRVNLIVSEKAKSPVRCRFGDNIAEFRTANAVGNAYDECPAAGDGKDLEIGFNCRYLLEALRAVPQDTIVLELSTGLSPILMLPDEGEKFLYMVLPVRLNSD